MKFLLKEDSALLFESSVETVIVGIIVPIRLFYIIDGEHFSRDFWEELSKGKFVLDSD